MRLLVVALALLFCLPLQAEEIRGRVQLLAKGGKGPARGSDVRQAVVYYEPEKATAVRTGGQPFEMVTRKKEFSPRVLVVPKGSRVRFPNQDPILHNVFSVSAPNQFDLGLYRKGPGKETKLESPGLVRVYCNIHHDMVAYVLVLGHIGRGYVQTVSTGFSALWLRTVMALPRWKMPPQPSRPTSPAETGADDRARQGAEIGFPHQPPERRQRDRRQHRHRRRRRPLGRDLGE